MTLVVFMQLIDKNVDFILDILLIYGQVVSAPEGHKIGQI